MAEKGTYIILGEDNHWYGYGTETTYEEAFNTALETGKDNPGDKIYLFWGKMKKTELTIPEKWKQTKNIGNV